jgi:hypothetical protein
VLFSKAFNFDLWFFILSCISVPAYIYFISCACLYILYFLWLYNEFFSILYNILKIKNCRVRLLSNYNIKYICTIYTRLYTCLTCIPRFALREKVTLRLLKLLFSGVDVVEWSRVLDVRLSEWCCSVTMVWVQIPSREEQNFDSSKI